jgi:hypothetical protein
LQNNGPNQEMRCNLHRIPNIGVIQNLLIVFKSNPFQRPIRLIGAKICEAQPDRPDQRKNVDRKQKKNCWGNENPCNRSVAQAFNAARDSGRCRFSDTLWYCIGHRVSLA